jgi:hypothetical protein
MIRFISKRPQASSLSEPEFVNVFKFGLWGLALPSVILIFKRKEHRRGEFFCYVAFLNQISTVPLGDGLGMRG